MYTHCPDCKTVYVISARDLRSRRGMMTCTRCSSKFDALATLEENPPENSGYKDRKISLPWDKKGTRLPAVFLKSTLIAVTVLLIFQFSHFEGDRIAQNPTIRPWLEKFCLHLNCRLPVYNNLNAIKILHGKLADNSDSGYQLMTAFENHASFPQPYPDLKLSLTDYQGTVVAERIFVPSDYLPKYSELDLLKSKEQIQVELAFPRPQSPVHGYTLDLI